MSSDFTAVCEPAKARSDVWDSPSIEAGQATANNDVLGRKTVRSGFAYDINGGGGSAESSERARRLKEELGSVPVTGIEDRVAYRFVKRAFDIVFSAAVLVVFCWLFAIIAILIKVDDSKGPVFFSQERVGKDGRTFRMLKFRSMCVDAEDRLAELRELNEKTGPVFKIAEDPRITRVGKWLRKLSLDELPQFVNVLRSDIPLRILKTRPEFSEKSMGAFALPAKSSTNKEKAFSQVVSCFLRTACGCAASLYSIVTASAVWKPNFLQNPFSMCLLCIRGPVSEVKMGWLKQHGNW